MLSVKQAKAFLVFAFAPSLSIKAADLILQPILSCTPTLLAKPIDATQNFFAVDKKAGEGHTEEDEGHPLHEEEEEADSCTILRAKTLAFRKRSRNKEHA